MNELVPFVGFWARLAAAALDALIVGLPLLLLGYFLSGLGPTGRTDTMLFGTLWIATLLGFFVSIVYIIVCPLTRHQGTLGKRIMGQKIVGEDGDRITLSQSVLRCLGMYVSYQLLCVGFLMIGLTPNRQGLHDLIAKTYVVAR